MREEDIYSIIICEKCRPEAAFFLHSVYCAVEFECVNNFFFAIFIILTGYFCFNLKPSFINLFIKNTTTTTKQRNKPKENPT